MNERVRIAKGGKTMPIISFTKFFNYTQEANVASRAVWKLMGQPWYDENNVYKSSSVLFCTNIKHEPERNNVHGNCNPSLNCFNSSNSTSTRGSVSARTFGTGSGIRMQTNNSMTCKFNNNNNNNNCNNYTYTNNVGNGNRLDFDVRITENVNDLYGKEIFDFYTYCLSEISNNIKSEIIKNFRVRNNISSNHKYLRDGNLNDYYKYRYTICQNMLEVKLIALNSTIYHFCFMYSEIMIQYNFIRCRCFVSIVDWIKRFSMCVKRSRFT